jgi:AraC family transcriptional regulator
MSSRNKDCSDLPGDATCFRNRDIVSAAHFLVRESARWNETSPLLAESICLELLARVARRPSTPPKKPPVWLPRAKEMFYEECVNPCRIADAAQAIGVHPVHFARSFRRFFHCTPGEYLVRCRLDRAITLLVESKWSLAEIALQTGFCDQSHFSNMFKRHFGISPRAYRSQLRLTPAKLCFSSPG